MSQIDIETLRRIPLEALNEGDLSVIDEVLSPAFEDHQVFPGLPSGAEGLKAFIRGLRQAMPDVKYEMAHEISEGDLVVQHMYAAGTMQGEFMGMQPTGKKACWSEFHIIRMQDGVAMEHWGLADQLEIFRQLGLTQTEGMEQAA